MKSSSPLADGISDTIGLPVSRNLQSKHSTDRMQQRGIPPLVIDLLLQFGEVVHDKHGTERYLFRKAGRRRAQAYLGNELGKQLDAYRHAYLVTRNGQLVTCGYHSRRMKS